MAVEQSLQNRRVAQFCSGPGLTRIESRHETEPRGRTGHEAHSICRTTAETSEIPQTAYRLSRRSKSRRSILSFCFGKRLCLTNALDVLYNEWFEGLDKPGCEISRCACNCLPVSIWRNGEHNRTCLGSQVERQIGPAAVVFVHDHEERPITERMKSVAEFNRHVGIDHFLWQLLLPLSAHHEQSDVRLFRACRLAMTKTPSFGTFITSLVDTEARLCIDKHHHAHSTFIARIFGTRSRTNVAFGYFFM